MSDVVYDGSDLSGGGGGSDAYNGGTAPPGAFLPSQQELDNAKQIYQAGSDYAQWSYEHHLQPDTHYASHSVYESNHFMFGGGTYNLNDKLFHSSYSVDFLLQSNDLDAWNNPYSQTVDISYSSDNVGRPVYSKGSNPAYEEFNNQLEQAKAQRLEAQTIDYNKRFDAGTLQNSKLSSQTYKTLTSGHDNGLYGAGTLGIDALAQNIVDIQNQINNLQLADSLSSDYSRITNTDHSQEIEALNAQLSEFQKQYASAVNDYNARYAVAKAKQNEESKGEWNFSAGWMVDPTFDAGGMFNFNMGVRQDINGFSNLMLSGDINSWMAGGSLYDAPRAGDVMFNVTGNMNTVRFLGIEDRNNIPDMTVEFANPEVFRVLGNLAGDRNFSIIPPTIYS